MGPRSNLAAVVFMTSPAHFVFEKMGDVVKH